MSESMSARITPARRQPRPALVRVESLAESFNVPIEVVLVEDLIQALVERVGGTAAADAVSPPTSPLDSHAAFVCPSPSATV